MNKNKVILCILFIITMIGRGYTGDMRTVIQTGHLEGINCLRYYEKENILFSVSDDGMVKVWDVKTADLLQSIRISFRPVEGIVVHPTKPYIAALEITGPSASILHVMDWKKDELIFRMELSYIPLFFTYSPKGSYLIYCKPEWASLSFHDAETGTQLPLFQKGFGIFSYITVSSSEKNIMTYQSSGKISYWEIKSQKQLLKIPIDTLSNLTAISISSNKRFIAASSADKLVIIDLLSGKVIAATPLEGITSTGISPDDEEIMCIVKKEGTSKLHRFHLEGNTLKTKPIALKNSLLENINTPVYGNNTLFFSTPEGNIYTLSKEDKPVRFTCNRLIQISDIAFTRNLIAIGNEKQIITFPLKLLDTSSMTNEDLTDIAFNVYENTFNTDVGLVFSRLNKLIVWSRDSLPCEFQVLNIKTGDIDEEYADFKSPIIQLDLLDNAILTLERNGRCKISDKITFEPTFEYTAKGMNKIIYISKNILVGARSKLNRRGSSLITINPKTGETVPLSDPSLLCYDLAYDPGSRYLYSLSIGHDDTGSITQFKAHFGKGYEKERIISSFSGEDLSASIAVVPGKRQVYTSLGFDAIKVWNERRVQTFPSCSHIPRKLYVADKFLLALNKDRSISIWDRYKQQKMLDLYFFEDFKWIAMMDENEFVTSEGAEIYVKNFYPQ